MRTQPRSAARVRRGFTLPELLVVLLLMGIVCGAILQLLARQQRFYKSTSEVIDNRTQLRDASFIVPADLRGISSIGGDIRAMGVTSVEFLSNIGSSIVCAYAGVGSAVVSLPPRTLSSGTTLTAWLSQPQPGDVVFLYDNGTTVGNADDTWARYQIASGGFASSVSPQWCPTSTGFTAPGDNTATSYQMVLSAAPNQSRSPVGSPIRFMRAVRYSLYQAADNRWYLGLETCDANVVGNCTDRQPISGPYLPATTDPATSGLAFRYYDRDGAELTNAADAPRVARIEMVVRSQTAGARATFGGGQAQQVRDSLSITIAVRNRV
jgi:prepilin-type N-terminal cleavage/methylation domain-containing protein